MRSRIPLKGYLSLHFGAVAILPVAIIFFLVWFLVMPAIQTRTTVQHQTMARAIAGQISAYLEGGERQLSALAGYLQNRETDSDPNVVDQLDAQCGSGAFFEALFVVDSQRFVVKTVGLDRSRRANRADYIGLDFSGRSFANAVALLKTVFWSQTFLSTVSSRMAVSLIVPLGDDFMVGEIPLGNLSEFVSLLPMDAEFVTLVIDSGGLIVADSQRRRSGQVLSINFSAENDPFGDKSSASSTFELDGVEMLGSVVQMNAVGWKVLFAQPVEKAFQPLRDTFAMIGLGLAIALGLALFIAWLLAGYLTDLFASFTDKAQAIASGRYHHHWPAAKTREFFQLSQSLGRMAVQINRREKALVDSEQRLKDLVTNVPGVVFQYKANPKALESSSFTSVMRERSVEIFGMDAEEKHYFNEFIACLPEEDQSRFAMSVKDALETAKPWHYEGRFIKPSGEEIWFEGRSSPRQIDDVVFHYGVMTDITQRKEMESRLRENEQLLTNILESMNDGVLVLDHEFNYQLFNKRMEAITGSSRSTVIGKTPWEAFSYVANTDVEKCIRSALKGTLTDSLEIRLPISDDLTVWHRDSFSPLKDEKGGVIGVVGVVSDITRQKQDEEELRRLRNYLSNIIDSMTSILVAVDRDGKVTQWNRQVAQATGLSFKDVRSQPLSEVFPRLADEMACIQTAILERRVISSRKSDNENRYEDITIFPLVGSGVEGAVIRVDDVTGQVRLEEMMIQSEKMLSVGGLAAGMAHEVNNPLAGILQNAAVLENRLLGDLPANRKAAEAAGTTLASIQHYLELRKLPRMIENIRDSGSRAAAIVRNMLSFARKSDRRVSSHDLGTLLDQALELVQTDYDMKKRYDVKQIWIEREYDPVAPPVPCEAGKIQQVFMNILKNGAEAMAGMTDASAPAAFVLRVRNDGGWVRVEIEDNGPGMDEKTRRRIFEPFFTTKPVGKGTGLGLSISYFIITDDHGGQMSVQATEGGGTCFVIHLPKAGKV